MPISVFDLFKIGIGPSSSHTVGPMKAAARFAAFVVASAFRDQIAGVRVELHGSLGATGRGHGSDRAVMLGLEGESPETIDVAMIEARLASIRARSSLHLDGQLPVAFREREHLHFFRKPLAYHPNGMRFFAQDAANRELFRQTVYSVGGGFVVDENQLNSPSPDRDEIEVPFPFHSGAELLEACQRNQISVSSLMIANEGAYRSEAALRDGLLRIWQVMQDCVRDGCRNEGVLPGGLNLRRRAPSLMRQLEAAAGAAQQDPLALMDWVNLYALAVNEENAAGGRVVTAPTNGAAGIIPAVLHYFTRHVAGATDDGVIRFFLTAAAIGILYKENASISGAEVGCQGEVGVACSMAAGALAEALGGSPSQVENAAEIGMEHNLGLTCDPVGGLVQVPCIERNAMGAIKAINAARLALRGDGKHVVSLDRVIRTMRETGADMKLKYKETARGGLALHVETLPVNIVEC